MFRGRQAPGQTWASVTLMWCPQSARGQGGDKVRRVGCSWSEIFPQSPAVSWLVPQGKEGIDGVAAPAQGMQDTATGWSHLLLRNSKQAQELSRGCQSGLGLLRHGISDRRTLSSPCDSGPLSTN